MEEDPATQYASLLVDLKMNSKPMINVLTMMAEDHIKSAPVVVQTIERHLNSVHPTVKLPVLYLIDSIVKNVGMIYPSLFTQNIVSTFCGVFEKVDDKVKQQMFKLRQTWNDVFPQRKLYAIDVRCHQFDRNWPISAPPPSNTSSIHVNPKFLNTAQPGQKGAVAVLPNANVNIPPTVGVVCLPDPDIAVSISPAPQDITEAHMRAKLLQKQKELLELQQKKIELELKQTQTALESKRFEEMESAIQQEKMLLSQAEMAKSKTNIAHKILSNYPPSSSSQSSVATLVVTQSQAPQPQTTPSLAPAPSVVSKSDNEKELKDREKDRMKDKECEKERDRGREKGKEKDRDTERRKRSSSSSGGKDEKDAKVRKSYKDSEKPRSPVKYIKSPISVKEEDRDSIEDNRSSISKRGQRKTSSSGQLDELISPSKGEAIIIELPRNKSKRSSSMSTSSKDSKDSKGKGRDGHRENKDKRSPTKHKKGPVIKEEDSFHARKIAVLKRNYRRTPGIEPDEDENKTPQKIPREDIGAPPSTDVDLRFHPRHDHDAQKDTAGCQSGEPSSVKKPTRSSGNGSSMIVDLFGREDVDLRQPTRCGSWERESNSGSHPPNWGMNHPRMNIRSQWTSPPIRSAPEGRNPFLIDDFPRPTEMELRPVDGSFKGPSDWMPNPRMLGGMGDQWGPRGPPFPAPEGPNPFVAALDNFNPHPNDLEMRPLDRQGPFKPLRGRRGPRGRGRGVPGGRGGFIEHHIMHPGDKHFMDARNFLPTPLFPDSEQQRMMRRPGEPTFNFQVNEPELVSHSHSDDTSSNSDLPDVTALLDLAAKFGLLPSSEPTKEPEKQQAKEEKIKVNDARESAILKYQKYQKYQRNNRKGEPQVVPPLPTVDVLLVTEEKNYLKERRQALIDQLWTGMQCASCGLRFPPDQAIRYSQHLDWHFRRNRKIKSSAKKAQSRTWYYNLSDWIKFEEIEDLDERAASLFEIQDEADAETISPNAVVSPEECTVVASGHEGALCPQCGEVFTSYYDEEKEEWRMNDAVLDETYDGEGKVYHYVCYQDYLKSMVEEPIQVEEEDTAMVDLQVIEEPSPEMEVSSPTTPSVSVDDDDDEVLILKEGKKEVVVIDVDDEDRMNAVKSDETNENEVKNKEIENGPDSPKESTTTTEHSDNLSIDDKPVRNYSIISRPIASPITVNDDSSSNLLPGISEGSTGGVFGFALNSGVISVRPESPDHVDGKKIVYKSMTFDFPKIKIEPPDVPEDDLESVFNPDDNDVPMPLSIVPVIDTFVHEPIDLTGEDDSEDTVDEGRRPLHQTTSIDGNLHQEEYIPVPFVPPAKIRINISGLDISASAKSPQSKPEEGQTSPKPTTDNALAPPSPSNTTTTRSPEHSDTSTNAEIVFTNELKCLKPSLAKFIESGRKFKNCPPKEGRKEESGLCVIS